MTLKKLSVSLNVCPELAHLDILKGSDRVSIDFQQAKPVRKTNIKYLIAVTIFQVEKWLLELEKSMKSSVHNAVALSYDDYLQRPREDWVLAWPGQAVCGII